MLVNKNLGFWSVVFLGIGSMIGAGIFVLLGEAGAIAGNLVWLSFVFGGIIALLSGYSLSKLSFAFPSRGGIVEYLVQCYGENIFSGTLSILFYLSGMVAISMVVKTFGTYAGALFDLNSVLFIDIFSIFILVCFVFVNLSGSKFMSRFENFFVFLKLFILGLFVIFLFFFIKPELLSFSNSVSMSNVFSSIALTFFAYEGFRVITNSVEDVDDPKIVSKAMFVSIMIVLVFYVLVSIVVFGTLSLGDILKYQDYVLAQAVKPFLGDVGFVIMGVVALISTVSSINANLYAITNVTYDMAKNGELPKIYDRSIWNSYEGLIISSFIMLFFILFLDLTQIAVIGSISILFIHLMVHVGHLFIVKKTGASRFLLIFSILSILMAIILALVYVSKTMYSVFYFLSFFVFLAFVLELILRKFFGRVISVQS